MRKERMQAFEDCEGKEADIVDEAIKIKEEESELDPERAQTIEYSLQDFVTCFEVQVVIKTEKKKPASHRNALVLAPLLEETLIEVLEVRYDTGKEGVDTPLLNIIGESTAAIMQQRMMNLLLVRNSEALTEWNRAIDTLMQRVAGCQSWITPMTAHVRHHINMI